MMTVCLIDELIHPPGTGYHPRLPSLPKPADCAGAENAALFGSWLLTAYLGLFIQFYHKSYVVKRRAALGEKGAVMNE